MKNLTSKLKYVKKNQLEIAKEKWHKSKNKISLREFNKKIKHSQQKIRLVNSDNQ